MQRILLLSLVLLAACQSDGAKQADKAEKTDLTKALPGTWEAVSLRVDINTYAGQDTSFLFEVKEEEWQRRLGVKPVRTVYSTDNKYRQEFYNPNGELSNTVRGVWNVFGDTLMMIAPDATYQYIVQVADGRSEYRALMDWDNDGEEDDEYLGVQRMVSMETE
jgi:hypothetical protein